MIIARFENLPKLTKNRLLPIVQIFFLIVLVRCYRMISGFCQNNLPRNEWLNRGLSHSFLDYLIANALPALAYPA